MKKYIQSIVFFAALVAVSLWSNLAIADWHWNDIGSKLYIFLDDDDDLDSCKIEIIQPGDEIFKIRITEIKKDDIDIDQRSFNIDRYTSVIVTAGENCPTEFINVTPWNDFGSTSILPSFYGSNKDDVMYGGFRMFGYGGDDEITHGSLAHGGYGNDTITNCVDVRAGEGNDIIYANNNDFPGWGVGNIDGGPGHDRMYIEYFVSGTLDGGEGNDFIRGCQQGNVIYGGPGVDVLYGGDGPDTIYAGPGNDWVFGRAGDDDLFGEQGYDNVLGEEGSDIISMGNYREPEGFGWGGPQADIFYDRDPSREGTILDDFDPSEGDISIMTFWIVLQTSWP